MGFIASLLAGLLTSVGALPVLFGWVVSQRVNNALLGFAAGVMLSASFFSLITVDVPARFRNSKAVGAVFGLTPSKHQSGESDRTGRISRCGDEMMRAMLYEAAHIMLVRSAKWSWLKAWAMKVARRRGLKKAIVALARRLAVIMHRIWVDGTEFRWTREVAAA
jgi:transposase